VKQDYAGAVRTFVQLEQRTLPGCSSIQLHIAEWLWKQGYLPAAKQAFAKVSLLAEQRKTLCFKLGLDIPGKSAHDTQ